jgi:hypothetical protein
VPEETKQITLPVSIYFVWEWWERYFQGARGRPDAIDFDWLDATYLGRQRFLYEALGEFGVGAAEPALDLAFVGKVLPFHTILVPVALGVEVGLQEAGGYCWCNVTEEVLRKIEPVDIANTWVGERVAREREHRLARYGVAAQMIDLASAANNAFTLRGPEFYADLIADPALTQHYLGAVTETMQLAYRFITRLFGPIEGFPLGNCNVVMMSPQLYVETIRSHDVRIVQAAAEMAGQPPCCDLHHCDVKTEPFAQAYRAIPGLRSLQGSYRSDVAAIRRALPGVTFSAMVNPVDVLNRPAAQLDAELERCVAEGINDVALWNIDTAYGPAEMRGLLRRVREIAARHGRRAEFSVIPFTWEELDWEFPRYRTSNAARKAAM